VASRDDARWFALAIRQANAGLGATYPNPCVGAVLVRRGEVVGAGRSAATGGPHAEVRAIAKSGARTRGATLYVTLEPCCHHGRTGPCTEAIVAAGIARVVVGVRDPAAHAAGRGIRALQRAGIEVEVIATEAAAKVHEHYLHHVVTGMPFVTLKSAASLDGRIAVASGDSKWITSEASRREGHRLRAQHHAIAVGAETVLRDDPRLDVRLVRGVSPIVVVFDGRLRLAGRDAAVLRAGTLVLHTPDVTARALARVRASGAEPVEVAAHEGRVAISAALAELGRRDIRSLLVEGGGRLVGAFVQAHAWQRWVTFIAPRVLGEGASMCAGPSWSRVADAPQLRREALRRLDEDLRIDWVPRVDASTARRGRRPSRRA
jgi:diaminohydroxyphosphoribosylaminopyrimidine deaminase/5-amino-6-(5-phosphoribosylamino)uracil reductase